MVGYEKESKNYRSFDQGTKKILMARDVIFNENKKIILPRNHTLVPIDESNLKDVEQESNESGTLKNEDEESVTLDHDETYQLRAKNILQKPKRYEVNMIETDVPKHMNK